MSVNHTNKHKVVAINISKRVVHKTLLERSIQGIKHITMLIVPLTLIIMDSSLLLDEIEIIPSGAELLDRECDTLRSTALVPQPDSIRALAVAAIVALCLFTTTLVSDDVTWSGASTVRSTTTGAGDDGEDDMMAMAEKKEKRGVAKKQCLDCGDRDRRRWAEWAWRVSVGATTHNTR